MWNHRWLSNSLVLDSGQSLFLLLLGLSVCHISELQSYRLRDLLLLCVSIFGTRLCRPNSNASGLHRSDLDRDLFGVPRNFREALSGNRRTLTETGGNKRKHTESRGIRFGASPVVVSWPFSLLSRVAKEKKSPRPQKISYMNDCSTLPEAAWGGKRETAALLNSGVGCPFAIRTPAKRKKSKRLTVRCLEAIVKQVRPNHFITSLLHCQACFLF